MKNSSRAYSDEKDNEDPIINDIDDAYRLRESFSEVTKSEKDERKIGRNLVKDDNGLSIKDGVGGYIAAINLFLALEKKYLLPKEIELLKKARDNLSVLLQDHLQITEEVNQKFRNGSGKEIKDYEERLDVICSTVIKKIAQEQYERLKQTGELYLSYGMSEHYEIIKIKSDGPNGPYHLTIYNAGCESEIVNQDENRGKVATRHNNHNFSKAQLEELITNIQRRSFMEEGSARYDEVSSAINSVLDTPGRFDHNSDQEQLRGNCVTRSTREALKEMLPDDLFNKLYNFVSSEEIIERNIQEFNIEPEYLNPSFAIQTQISHGAAIAPTHLAECLGQYFFHPTELNKKGTLLHYAIFKNRSDRNFDLIKKLLALGMTGGELDMSGDSALLYAVKMGNNEAFDQILDNSKEDYLTKIQRLVEINRYGQSVIMTAIEKGNFDVINKCIMYHIDLRPRANNRYSIIKLLADKAQQVEPQVSIQYLNTIDLIFQSYAQDEIALYAEDGIDEDLFSALRKQIAKESYKQDAFVMHELQKAINNCIAFDNSLDKFYINKVVRDFKAEKDWSSLYGGILICRLIDKDKSFYDILLATNDPDVLRKLGEVAEFLDEASKHELLARISLLPERIDPASIVIEDAELGSPYVEKEENEMEESETPREEDEYFPISAAVEELPSDDEACDGVKKKKKFVDFVEAPTLESRKFTDRYKTAQAATTDTFVGRYAAQAVAVDTQETRKRKF